MESKKSANLRPWILIAALLLLFAVMIFLLAGNQRFVDVQQEETVTSTLEMDENAVRGGLVTRSQEEIQAELNQKVEEGMINISMNTSPTFPSGKEKGNLLIVNNEVNNYPQVVYILRKDTGEEIYRSKGIPVGSKIEYAPLDVELPAGEYGCVAYFNNVDPVTGAILGTAGAEIKVTVQR